MPRPPDVSSITRPSARYQPAPESIRNTIIYSIYAFLSLSPTISLCLHRYHELPHRATALVTATDVTAPTMTSAATTEEVTKR